MTTTPAIDIRGLRVMRGKHEVLHSLDLPVSAGSITGLLGPSGCGKTTLMRASSEPRSSKVARSPCSGDLRGAGAFAAGSDTSPSRRASTPTSRRANVGYFGALYGRRRRRRGRRSTPSA